jgi:hypothetical protein
MLAVVDDFAGPRKLVRRSAPAEKRFALEEINDQARVGEGARSSKTGESAADDGNTGWRRGVQSENAEIPRLGFPRLVKAPGTPPSLGMTAPLNAYSAKGATMWANASSLARDDSSSKCLLGKGRDNVGKRLKPRSG